MHSPTLVSPIDNPFESYKTRHALRTSKLEKLLGEISLDISGVEIEKEGLKALLQSKVPLAYFFANLIDNYSTELICFYLDVERYLSCTFTTLEKKFQCAQQIFTTYLDPRSFLEVNVGDHIKREIMNRMKQGDLDGCFEPAKAHILGLLDTSYGIFKQSETFQVMKASSDGLFSLESRQKAYDMLQKYAVPLEEGRSESPTRKRKVYLTNLINEFCQRILKIKAKTEDRGRKTEIVMKKTSSRSKSRSKK